MTNKSRALEERSTLEQELLNQKFATLEEENRAVEEQLDFSRQELEEMKVSKEATENLNVQALQGQQESILEMTNKSRALEERFTLEQESLNKKFAALEEEKRAVEEHLDFSRQELEEMKVLNEATAKRNVQALQDQQESILGMTNKSRAQEERSTLEQESLNKKFAALEEEKRAVEEQLDSSRQELEEVKVSKEATANRNVQALQGQQENMLELANNNLALEEQCKQGSQECHSLREAVRNTSTAVESLEAQLVEAKEGLRRNIEDLSAARIDLRETIDLKTKAIEDLQRQLQATKNELEAKEAVHYEELNAKLVTANFATDEAENAKQQVSLLEKAVEKAHSALTSSSKEASLEMDDLRRCVQNATGHRDEMLEILQEKNKEVEDLNRQLLAFRQDLKEQETNFEQRLADEANRTRLSVEDAATAQKEKALLETGLQQAQRRLAQLSEHSATESRSLRRSIVKLQSGNKEQEGKKLKLVTKRGVGEQQKQRLEDLDHEIEEAILDREDQKASIVNELSAQQARTESLLQELTGSQEEVGNLRRELDRLTKTADRDSVAAVSELEQLGELALAELEKLGGAVETFQHRNENQSKTILLLERKIQEIMKQHEKVESHLREQLSIERAKFDEVMSKYFNGSRLSKSSSRGSREHGDDQNLDLNNTSQHSMPFGLLTLIIPEEKDPKDGDDGDSIVSAGGRSFLSESGSVTSGLVQSGFLARAARKKRQSSTWGLLSSMIFDDEEGKKEDNTNEILKKRISESRQRSDDGSHASSNSFITKQVNGAESEAESSVIPQVEESNSKEVLNLVA
jgi:chromosome segregation ATPase